MKRVLTVLMIVLSAVFIQGCYLLKQGVSLVRYYRGGEEIKAVLSGENLDAEERAALVGVSDVRSFAVTELGLKSNENYTRYKRIDRDYLVDVVSACEKTSFTPVVWRFPFFGAFPYKGFFKREDALRLADRLRKKGYDVFVRRAEAFSTLGFFKDPVFSFMTDYPEYDMASLIIHEQTHATIFVKNSTEFNEQLATFVGREGALLYLRRKYGEGSTEYRAVLEDLEDEQRFFDLMGDLYRRLDRLYRSDAGEEEKAERRKQIFDDFQSDLGRNYNSYFKTGAYRRMTELSMNNAVVLSVMRYTQDLSLFYRFYEENGCDLPLMIRRLSALLAERKRGGRKGRMLSPAEYLRRSIEEGSAMGHGN